MSYSCRVYSNSGFNAVNIPDEPTLLDNVAYVDYPILEILQDRNLGYIDIKVSNYNAIKNADYCRVNDWFYFIDEIFMLSGDTARLILTPDFITSAGGINTLDILDGITTRVHVGSDNYGEWNELDPYMTPAEPLIYSAQNVTGSKTTEIVVKTTLDLSAMGTATQKDGVTYTDPTTGETVTVPKTIVNQTDTEYRAIGGTMVLPGESATKLFDAKNLTVKRAISEVNDLGINGAITAQVEIPSNFIILTKDATTGAVTIAQGADYETPLTAVPFEYTGARNKKLDYSELTPFGILTASGDKAEFMASDIYNSGANPSLRTVADPRTDGKPYFRFNSYKGDTSLTGFFMNAVTGMPWKQTPLVYEGASGKALMDLSLAQSFSRQDLGMRQKIEEANSQIRAKSIGLAVAGGITGGVIGIGAATLGAGALGVAGVPAIHGLTGVSLASMGAVSTAFSRGVDEFTGQRGLERAYDKYKQEKAIELSSYLANTEAYAPVMQFPFSADLFNDLYNNPCVCYRYMYNTRDIARIDKILTMYGYRVTKALQKTDFTNREYFNYVESSISVGGSIPRWLANGIAVQLSNGVRIWHVLPNSSHYTNNPIA